jgi:rubrerythrin
MASLKGSETEQNLKDASAGESQANRSSVFVAKHADIEG